MADWQLTNVNKVKSIVVYDLYRDGFPVLQGAPYVDAFAHVLANGADTDTYIEDHMSTPQTVAELRAEQAKQVSMFAGLFGAHAGTAPERQCGSCLRWGHWWGKRCPHCGAQG